ncbi:MAG: hypothetical protein J6B22_02150 [Clostridia bacterium]|nr:hypothetical protein [Clostridia bacterium]
MIILSEIKASFEIVVKSQIMRVIRYAVGITESTGEISNFKNGEIPNKIRYKAKNKLKILNKTNCQGSTENSVLKTKVSNKTPVAKTSDNIEVVIFFWGRFSGLLKLKWENSPTDRVQSKIKHKKAFP